MKKKRPSKKDLARLYWDEQMTQGEIAKLYNCSDALVGNWMRNDGIPTRNTRAAQRAVTLDKETLYELYVEQKKSSVEIAALYDGLDDNRVLLLLKRNDIPRRPQWQACGGWNKGIPLPEHQRQKFSEAAKLRTGTKNANYGKVMSDEQKQKISNSLKGRFRGPDSPNWIANKKYRKWRCVWHARFEYKEWRSCVFARDNYTCQMCGKPSNGDIEAHHIKPVDKYRELIIDKDNGITLCISCHRSIKGKENRYEKQFSEYIASLPTQQIHNP